MVLGATLIAFVILGFLWRHISQQGLLFWLFAILASAGLRSWVFLSFRCNGHKSPGTGQWGFLFWFSSLLAGCVWAALPLIFYTEIRPEFLLLISTVFAGMVAVTASAGSIYLPSFYSFSLPLVVPLAILHVRSGVDYLVVTGAMLLLFLLVNVLLARRGHRQYVELIEARFSNADLMEKLSAEKSIAEKAVLAKNRFLAAASHDLRQPLHALGLFLGSLRKRENDTGRLDIISDMEASTTALGQLLHSLLDISKLEAGVVEVERTQVKLQDLTHSLATEFQPLASQKQLSLNIDTAEFLLYTDAVLLERILRNLLSNAIRYTHSGNVYLAVRQAAGNRVELVVGDTGVGMSTDEQQQVFTEYHQLRHSTAVSEHSRSSEGAALAPPLDASLVDQGLGLGLSIVEQLCQLMEVPLTMHSVPDQGTEFILELPAGRSIGPARVNCSVGPITLSALVVMVIDDDQQVLDATCGRLADWGCQVLPAASTKAALFQLAMSEAEPDIIVCDYRLGQHETGLDAVMSLREGLGKHIPAVIITGDTSPDMLKNVAESQLAVLHKPVSEGALKWAIAELLPTVDRPTALDR